MVMQVMKRNIHPDKVKPYAEWAQGAIQRTLGSGDVIEFRGYRPASGSSQIVVTYEFADMVTWAAWYYDDDTQQVIAELRTMANDVTSELWGPSPVVPQPIRPGG